MSEWLIEEGIGETRSLLIEGGEAVAAKLEWPGELTAGTKAMAQLIATPAGARRGVAQLENGAQVLIDHLPRELTEGASFALHISRAAIAERGRFKRAHGRYHGPSLTDALPKDQAEANTPLSAAKVVPAFEAGQWEEVWHAASSGSIAFAGGEIVCSVTPAMTVIDIDGEDDPKALALAAVPAITQSLRLFDLGGNIGIDFPTIEAKADRRAVDEALSEALSDWPHERTAMNGFGFVQLVARLEGPSLLHRFATSRTGLCARYALRAGERAQGNGPMLELRVHPALKAKLKPQWIEELTRRTGKQVRIETDPALALEAPHAQILST
ncbi:MAG: ribonuclease E/G [Pseudomonadota bacterium]